MAVVVDRAEDVDHVLVGQVRDFHHHHFASVTRLQNAVLVSALGVPEVLPAFVLLATV